MEDATLFWKVANGEHPCPRASSLLGWEFIFYEPQKRQVRVRFHATQALTTPLECIHGGMLTAMLDDCMGSAVFAALDVGEAALLARIEARLIRPTFPGHVGGVARITRRLKNHRYTSAELHDEAGNLLATAKAAYTIVSMPPGGTLKARG